MQDEDIYSYTVENLRNFIPEGYVLVSSFNESNIPWKLKYFSAGGWYQGPAKKNKAGLVVEILKLKFLLIRGGIN